MHKALRWFFQFFNIMGLALALPLLVAVAMSFDHPSDPPHPAHLAFVFGTLAFPILSLAGIVLKNRRYLGFVGMAFAVFGMAILHVVCDDAFRCNT